MRTILAGAPKEERDSHSGWSRGSPLQAGICSKYKVRVHSVFGWLCLCSPSVPPPLPPFDLRATTIPAVNNIVAGHSTAGQGSRRAATDRLRRRPFLDLRRPHHSQPISRWVTGEPWGWYHQQQQQQWSRRRWCLQQITQKWMPHQRPNAPRW